MAKEGAGGGPDWNGLLKWSLAHGGDGTTPSRALSEEDRKWFMEAMQANTIDVVGRMKEIAQVMKTPDDVLQSHGVTTENIEDMLDELQEHVESIDMANDVCRVRVAGRIWPKNADELAQGADFDNIVELQPEALLLLARSIEADPSTFVFYLHIYYQKDEGLGTFSVNCRRMGGGRRARSPVLWHHARRGRGLGVGDVNLAVASDAWRSWRNFLWPHDEASGLAARQGPNSMTTFFLGGR